MKKGRKLATPKSRKSAGQPTKTRGIPAQTGADGQAARNEFFPIVGIGASAGGLDSFTQLLKHLPAHTGMAFVLVQHLDPDHESALAQILQPRSLRVRSAMSGPLNVSLKATSFLSSLRWVKQPFSFVIGK